jgi:hypothetical protein
MLQIVSLSATSRRRLPGLFLLMLTAFAGPCPGQDISLAAAVRFSTLCTRCHEGECSGRLSFSLGCEATFSHIRRYLASAGYEPSTQEMNEHFQLLKSMKTDCRYHALPVSVPADRIWSDELLGKLRNPAENAYFIPLGRLLPGRYRALLRFDRDCSVNAEAVSARFEVQDTQFLSSYPFQTEVRFSVPVGEEYFLRLFTGQPAALLGLELEPRQ